MTLLLLLVVVMLEVLLSACLPKQKLQMDLMAAWETLALHTIPVQPVFLAAHKGDVCEQQQQYWCNV